MKERQGRVGLQTAWRLAVDALESLVTEHQVTVKVNS